MNKKVKTLWGISEVGFFMMSSMETMFFMFFLTNVAMIPLFITGIITSFSAIVDAFSAVLAGFVIDKVKFRNGKYRPWLLICPPLVTVFFVLMFTKIGGNVTAGIICSVCYILSHFVWNICWTANRDLITVISKDPQDRAWLSSRIGVGSNIGKIGNSLVVPTVSAALLGVLSGVGAYTVIALIFALCFSVCYVIHYVITKGYDTTENVVGKPISLGEMFRSIFSNSQLLAFFLHDTIRQIAFIGIGSMTSYYCLVVLGNQALSSTMLIAFYVGGVIGGVIAPQFTKRIGSKKTNLIGVIGWGVCSVLTIILPANLVLVSAVFLLGQIFFGMSYGLTVSFFAMSATYGEYKTGKSARGLVMAVCSLSIKCAVALRGVMIPIFLGFIGYEATAAVTPALQSSMKSLFGIFPLVFIVLSLIPLFFFKIDDKDVKKMEAEIAARTKETA